MSLSVSAVWQNMQLEDYENQPYLYNGDPAWGELVTEIWLDKWLLKRFYIHGLFALLTCSTPESKDKEINWVKPRKLIKAAERLKRRLNNNSDFINCILKIYSKYAIGIESAPVELAKALDSIIEVAEFVENVGGTHMSFRMEW